MAIKDYIRKGRELEFKYNGTKVGRVISFNLSVDGETIDISDIDSGEWSEFIRGRKNWNVSLTAHRVEDTGSAAQQIALTDDFVTSQNSGSIELGPATPASGDVLYSGDVYVTNFTLDNAGSDDAVESSWELQGTGTLTRTTTA